MPGAKDVRRLNLHTINYGDVLHHDSFLRGSGKSYQCKALNRAPRPPDSSPDSCSEKNYDTVSINA